MKPILIGVTLWAIAIASVVFGSPRNESSYAKGFQVQLVGKQWGV